MLVPVQIGLGIAMHVGRYEIGKLFIGSPSAGVKFTGRVKNGMSLDIP
jgi:hypothetical protein